jgi:predicted nucleic acid-binding protein
LDKALIDANFLSYFLNGDKKVTAETQNYLVHYDKLLLSQITYFEILAGLEYKQADIQISKFQLFASKCSILSLTENSLNIAAKVYGELRRKGIQIGTPDLLIAGIALDQNLNLVTNNEKHYRPIERLTLVNWKEK